MIPWMDDDTLVRCEYCEEVNRAEEWGTDTQYCGDGCCSWHNGCECPACGRDTMFPQEVSGED